MDWPGIALMAVGLASLQYVLEEGSRNDWFESHAHRRRAPSSPCSRWRRSSSASSRRPCPAVDLSLFKDRVFLSGTLIGAVMFAMLMAITFLLPVFMQELLGFTATQSGLALMPRTLVMMVGMPIVGRLYNKVSPRILVAFGVVLFSLSAVPDEPLHARDRARATVIVALIDPGLGFAGSSCR